MANSEDATTQALNANPVNDGNGKTDQLTEREIRYKQQMEWSAQEAKRLAGENSQAEERANKYKQALLNTDYKRVYRNNNFNSSEFQEIFNEDPDHAEELAKMFEIDGKSANAEQIIQRFSDNTTPVTHRTIDPELMKKQLKEELMAEFRQDKVSSVVNSHFWSLPENVRTIAEARYKDITWGRQISETEVENFVKMAITLANAQAPQNTDRYVAQSGSMVQWGNIGFNPITPHDSNKISDDDYKDAIKEMFWMFPQGIAWQALSWIYHNL